jgi:hypothetical protein
LLNGLNVVLVERPICFPEHGIHNCRRIIGIMIETERMPKFVDSSLQHVSGEAAIDKATIALSNDRIYARILKRNKNTGTEVIGPIITCIRYSDICWQ